MDTRFDAIVLGTGLTESIVAAALSKAGLKVVHIDKQSYYGGTEASLTTNELYEWASSHEDRARSLTSTFNSASINGHRTANSRAYSLSLAPSIIVSAGPLISSLIGSGVSKYGGFKLLDHLLIYSGSTFKPVPGSKEEIFKSKDISLVDKRRLMRFLVFASGDFDTAPELQGKEEQPFISFLKNTFSLNDELSAAIAFALALCTSDDESTLTSLKRIKSHLRSAGRYGPSPFLVGHYGGLGELAQGYCRICAVSGGTYILGREISSITRAENGEDGPIYHLSLNNLDEDVRGSLIIASPEYLPELQKLHASVPNPAVSADEAVYCIAIVNGPLTQPLVPGIDQGNTLHEGMNESRMLDATLLVFPPGSLATGSCEGSVNVLVNGEGIMSCPKDHCILYLCSNSRGSEAPEELLRPYLNATVSQLRTASGEVPYVQCSTFYKSTARHCHEGESSEYWKERNVLLCRSLPSSLALNGDAAAVDAERLFRTAMQILGRIDSDHAESIWPSLLADQDDED